MFASLRVVTPPATEPVEIASIRRHCRVDSNYDDDLLTAYAISARTLAEQYLNRALITQELLFSMMHSPPHPGDRQNAESNATFTATLVAEIVVVPPVASMIHGLVNAV
jgi:hypothetical protein